MTLPASLNVFHSAFAGDGGTIAVGAADEEGKKHSIVLVQHAFAKFDPRSPTIPGRLYFNGEAVEVRSIAEGALLELLRHSIIQLNGDGCRQGVQSIIDYVASVDYVAFAAARDEMRRRNR